MKLYRCHKIVAAAKINNIGLVTESGNVTVSAGDELFSFPFKWVMEKKAEVGGYLVHYDDNYF